MTEIEIAYAAGLFDGEGCVSINKITGKKYTRSGFQLRCSISITDERIVDFFVLHFGGNKKAIKRPNARDYWQWVVAAKNAKNFLLDVSPYLIVKSDVADLGLKFQINRDLRAASRKTDQEWEEENKLYVEVRKCNARWGTEYYVG